MTTTKTIYAVTVQAIDGDTIYLRALSQKSTVKWMRLHLPDCPALFRQAFNLQFSTVVLERLAVDAAWSRIKHIGPAQLWPILEVAPPPPDEKDVPRYAAHAAAEQFIEAMTGRLQWRAALLTALRPILADVNVEELTLTLLKKHLPSALASECDANDLAVLYDAIRSASPPSKKRKAAGGTLESLVLALSQRDVKKLVPSRDIKQCATRYFTDEPTPIQTLKVKTITRPRGPMVDRVRAAVADPICVCRLYLTWNGSGRSPAVPVVFCDVDAIWWPYLAPRVDAILFDRLIAAAPTQQLTAWLEWLWLRPPNRPSPFAASSRSAAARRLIEMIERMVRPLLVAGQVPSLALDTDDVHYGPSHVAFSHEKRLLADHIMQCLWQPLLVDDELPAVTALRFLLNDVWYHLETATVASDRMESNRAHITEGRDAVKGALLPQTARVVKVPTELLKNPHIMAYITAPELRPLYTVLVEEPGRRRLSLYQAGATRGWIVRTPALNMWAVLGHCWLQCFASHFACSHAPYERLLDDSGPFAETGPNQPYFLAIYDNMISQLVEYCRHSTAIVYCPDALSCLLKASAEPELQAKWKKVVATIATTRTVRDMLNKELIRPNTSLVVFGMEMMTPDELLQLTAAICDSAPTVTALDVFCSGDGHQRLAERRRNLSAIHVISSPAWGWNPHNSCGATAAHLANYFCTAVPSHIGGRTPPDGSTLLDIIANLQAISGGGNDDDVVAVAPSTRTGPLLLPTFLGNLLRLEDAVPPLSYRVDWTYHRTNNTTLAMLDQQQRVVHADAIAFLACRRSAPLSVVMPRRDWLECENQCIPLPMPGRRMHDRLHFRLSLRTLRGGYFIHPGLLFNRVLIYLPTRTHAITLIHHETFEPLPDPMAEIEAYCKHYSGIGCPNFAPELGAYAALH